MDLECRPADEEERLERKGGETVKRDRQTDRQIDRQTDRDSEGERNSERFRERETSIERERNSETQ